MVVSTFTDSDNERTITQVSSLRIGKLRYGKDDGKRRMGRKLSIEVYIV